MQWNWQYNNWPEWQYERERVQELERRYLCNAGKIEGVFEHLSDADRRELSVAIASREIEDTAAIEGEYLDRDSVRESLYLRMQGISLKHRNKQELDMVTLLEKTLDNLEEDLSEEVLHMWHTLVCGHDVRLQDIGCYRTNPESMEIVSGSVGKERVHFQAVPTGQVGDEMQTLIDRFNESNRDATMGAVERAALFHVYFLAIHPYEDGNGRIARALSYRALMQAIDIKQYIALSYQINTRKQEYYRELEKTNTTLDISDWMVWFGELVVASQEYTLAQAQLVISKTQLFDRWADHLNVRQEKIINKLFELQPDDFEGGLSAKNYQRITGASAATTTRDLRALEKLGIVESRGENKGKRYYLNTREL